MKKPVLFFVISLLLLFNQISASAQEASEEADVVREAVSEKIEQAQNKPKAYMGTVTDIAENTVQIKSLEGEIQQVLINDDTSFVKINGNTQSVKFSDVAIGDFLVNMGYVNENQVLVTKRVLITDEPAQLAFVSQMGKVGKNSGDEITVEKLDGQGNFIVTPDATVFVSLQEEGDQVKTTFAKIPEGAVIIAVGLNKDDGLQARRINVISLPPEEKEE